MRLLDRALERMGLQRRTGQRSAYAGAAQNRLLSDWVFAVIRSADQEVRGDHRKLVARARELARNTGIGRRFVGLVGQNVIGADGIRLQARTKTTGDEFDRDLNRRIEAAWQEWGAPENASADRKLSWVDIEQRAVEDVARDGEALIRMLPAFDNPFGFALQLLDPDQLDVELNRAPAPGLNEIRMGVEIDVWGAPVRYWIWGSHPDEYGRARERIPVPAEEIIHLYRPERAGQTRGVTWFAPVLRNQRMLAAYIEAELIAARISASTMGFLKPGETSAPPKNPSTPGASPQLEIEAEPGKFPTLPGHDWSVEKWQSEHPTNAFPEFVKAMLRDVATGFQVTYPSLTGDMSDANYSSMRSGKLDERDVWRTLQVWVSAQMHRRVYLAWMKWAYTVGRLALPSGDIARWSAHQWQPRGWDWVDPEKDMKAALLEIRAGLNSRTRIAAAHGRDFEEILADLDRENQLATEYGVTLSTETKDTPPKGEANGDEAGRTADTEADGRDRPRRAAGLLRIRRV